MAYIVIPQPSMACHAYNVPGWKYQMHNTWPMSADEEMQHIADWTTSVAKGAGGLKCLIFNSHGSCGRAALSKKAALQETEAAKFTQIKGNVKHIIIVACSVIGVKPGQNDKFWKDHGVQMCYALARESGARVYAANVSQYVNVLASIFGGGGDIDDFEGDILCMPPSGTASWVPSNDALQLMLKNT